jgi:hypothetical protein
MSSLARELQSKGYLVNNAEMAWSGRRLYDVDYPAALKEIEQEVQQLRAKGAKRVVVAGQTWVRTRRWPMPHPASISTGWWSYRRDIFQRAGWGNGCALVTSEQKAWSRRAANRGADSDSFEDINQGKQRSLKMTAGIYVSYFDPNGLGAITKNIKKFSKPVPVLLVIGTGDPFYPEAKAMFDSAPANAASRYVALNTDHFNMSNVVAAEFVKWIDSFAQ